MSTQVDLFRADFEPWFERWNSVLFFPNPSKSENELLISGLSGNGGSYPGHQHKTCGGIMFAHEKYPPRVCTHCGVDTAKEITERETPGGICLP